MPRSLATSGTVDPEASLPSASPPSASLPSPCQSFWMICSGECLLPIESPPFAHSSGLLGSHRNWIRFLDQVPGVGSWHLIYAQTPWHCANVVDGLGAFSN